MFADSVSMRVSFVLRSAEEICQTSMLSAKSKNRNAPEDIDPVIYLQRIACAFFCSGLLTESLDWPILTSVSSKSYDSNQRIKHRNPSQTSESYQTSEPSQTSESPSEHGVLNTSIPRLSLAVPQPSTHRALHFLALEFGWDPAFAVQYDRR